MHVGIRPVLYLLLLVSPAFAQEPKSSGGLSYSMKQITHGPKHHFFGYFGHVRTIPWNASGRYLVALETDFQERMPEPGEAARIVLIDTQNQYEIRPVAETRAWNFQQGTMLYWNPQQPETQFFFNDRDPQTNQVFCVLFDITKGAHGQRIAEFRYPDHQIGNSGVAQLGGWFLGINYGRLARLRPVTGYPGVSDWTRSEKGNHPTDDGIFRVNVETKEKTLLVSFRQLADSLRPQYPDVDQKELFINHTLWSRNDQRIYFFVRGDFEISSSRLDVPYTMKSDGTDLKPLAMHIGGHPEWESDSILIGSRDKKQIRFDIMQQKVLGPLCSVDLFPQPGGDIALSPDGKWFINGHGQKGKNYYTILRRSDEAWLKTEGFNQGGYTGGELRIDPSPNWNRDSSQILVVAVDSQKTRQIHLITVDEKNKP